MNKARYVLLVFGMTGCGDRASSPNGPSSLSSIGVKAEDAPAQECHLDCKMPRRLPSGWLSVKPVLPPETLQCSSNEGQPLAAPLTVRLKVTTTVYSPDQPPVEQAVAGLPFEPSVYGNMAMGKEGPAVPQEPRYVGIVTSPSAWCSDSCGNITFLVWPNCPAGGSNFVAAGADVDGGTSGFASFEIYNNREGW